MLEDGKAIKDDESFSVTCLAKRANFASFLADENRAFTQGEERVKDMWSNHVNAGGAVLAQPESYIILR